MSINSRTSILTAAVLGAGLILTGCMPIDGTAVSAPTYGPAADQPINAPVADTSDCAEIFRLSDKAFAKGAIAFDASDRWLRVAAQGQMPSITQLEASAAAIDEFGDASTEVTDFMERSSCTDPAYADDISAAADLATSGSETLDYLTDAADDGIDFNYSDLATARAGILTWNGEYAAYQAVRNS